MRVICWWLVVGCVPGWAALNGIVWPGWQLGTSETMSSLHYPITQMLDGNPRTAWVFNRWGSGTKPATMPVPDDTFDSFEHGKGIFLYLTRDRAAPIVCDGIGICNGYAKDRTTYLRNNRITKLTIFGYVVGAPHIWQQSYTLRETTALQRLPIPHLRLTELNLRVDGVAAGPDDDLCISELVLYHGAQPLAWRVPPAVLTTPEIECDGRPRYQLVRGHHVQPLDGRPASSYGGFPQPQTPIMLLLGGHTLYLFDLRRAAVVWQHAFPGTATDIGWVNATQALLCTAGPHRRRHWYRLDAARRTWQPSPPPAQRQRRRLRDFTDEGC